jgi:hypothetical protein
MELAREVYAGVRPLPQAETVRIMRMSLPGVASQNVDGLLSGSECGKSLGAARGARSEFEFESELANHVGPLGKGLCDEAVRRRDKDSRTH